MTVGRGGGCLDLTRGGSIIGGDELDPSCGGCANGGGGLDLGGGGFGEGGGGLSAPPGVQRYRAARLAFAANPAEKIPKEPSTPFVWYPYVSLNVPPAEGIQGGSQRPRQD